MMSSNLVSSMNVMNNSGMVGLNPMMANVNQMHHQRMSAGNMMSTRMNVNNPMGGNNPMKINNKMDGMTINAGKQMQQQAQQVNFSSFSLFSHIQAKRHKC